MTPGSHLSMATSRQCLVTLGTFEAASVPVLSQRAHLLRYANKYYYENINHLK